ncbi:MAG: hypothetical protein KF805_12725 [Phycisphaeraceae bacterium]|nr:hypothetical protein [Phycisphaeraceae bacterium]
MTTITPVSRSAPSASNPHLYVFDVPWDFSHPCVRHPSILVQTSCNMNFVYTGVPGGTGSPNSLGYTAPSSYAGIPASNPTTEDFIENAVHAARACAINMHYRGQHLGSGEYVSGARSGCLYIKGFGVCKKADASDPCPVQFGYEDRLSSTAPSLIETNCGTASFMSLVNVPWSRFSPYNANSIVKAQAWARAFCAELKSQLDNFTLHSGGAAKLCYPHLYIDDLEDYMRAQNFSLVSSVTDVNKTSFVDYNAGDPTHLLGQSIPGYVYRNTILNMIYEADGTTELDRFKNEKIWAIYSNGQWQEKTFKEKWTEWLARGIFTGAPLPVSRTQTQNNELEAFGMELRFWAIYRGIIQPFIETFGYAPITSNYQDIKGPNNYSEQWRQQFQNFGWDEQLLDCRISQGSAETYDIDAALAEIQRRYDLCDKDKPIVATMRVRSPDDTGVTYGTFDSSFKPICEYMRHKGVHRFNLFLLEDQLDEMYQAWIDFRASIEADDTSGPTVLLHGRRGKIARSASRGVRR